MHPRRATWTSHPAETFQDDEEVIQAFAEANKQAITWLHHDGRLPSIAWIQLIPAAPERRAPGAVLWGFPSMMFGMRSDVGDAVPGLASVHTRLGQDDLATVDALINAGIASSRAEVVRWAIGHIRENPAYTQILVKAREISETDRPDR